jgi:glyoxylase-like metal-dependent hydrolase (beta-lactamase superfamily II)
MAIRALNCATMRPWWPRWQIGAACLLVETEQGLALVDTGLGLHDYASPSPIVRFFQKDFGIEIDPELAAVRQVARLGYHPQDVRHIILTHLHFDHAGGLPDFPQVQVHVHRHEYEAMLHPRGWIELAYDRLDFAHGPRWELYEQRTCTWLGWDAIRLPFSIEMYLIPLFGHTRGHCGVALRDGDGWLFQCADALPTNTQFDLTPEWVNRVAIGPHVPRLQQWAVEHPDVRLLAGHMWLQFFEVDRGG